MFKVWSRKKTFTSTTLLPSLLKHCLIRLELYLMEFFFKKKIINLFLSLLIQFYEKYQKIIYDQCMTKSMLISYLIWLCSSIMGVSPKKSWKHLPLAHNEIKVSHQIMDAPKSKFSLSYEHVLHCYKKEFLYKKLFYFIFSIHNIQSRRLL